ncbi:TRAP transporter large permease [Roseixanthobacter glucoisosaccharinicivorans]|uniref:TRAP transporter large permease n=1 Tax=Roseixanthobacter glucoisosaccharinicivorans TaxID=3119923 RepID=UPI003728E675
MSSITVAVLVLGLLLLLLVIRIPIALALIASAMTGIGILRGFDTVWTTVAKLPYDFAAHWSLSAIPMFLLMGSIAFNGGLTASLFDACRLWMGRLPGGLALAANFACAMFAAASGSSVATSAAMARIAVPEMLKSNYDPGLATGVVAAAGTIGAMIPPSIAFIIYGWYTGQPIKLLLIAGILPGILTAVIYSIFIIARVKMNPALAPQLTYRPTEAEKVRALIAIWPIPVLISIVIGSMYSGIATATEAGAIGSACALVICAFRGNLTFRMLRDSIGDATSSTVIIMIIAVGASLLAKFLALSGMPQAMGGWVVDHSVSASSVLAFTIILYLILGMFLDPIGIMLVTLPVLLPMFEALDLNLIWMGVLIVKLIEIGLLTPPVGLNIYVVKGVMGDQVKVETIFKGAFLFLAAEVVITGLLIAFPSISLVLPNAIR